MKNKSLILHQGALGDLIVTLNALSAVTDKTHIDICCKPSFMPLLKYLDAADQTFNIEHRQFAPLYAGVPQAQLTPLFSQYRRIILFTYATDLVNAVGKSAPCPVFKIPPRPVPHCKIHVTDFLTQQLCPIFCKSADNIRQQFNALISLKNSFSKVILIHPGSGSLRKNWPIINYIQLDRYLRQNGYRPKWIIGPAEKIFLKTLAGHNIADNNVYPSLNVIEFAEELTRSVGFIGNDSGLSHLAAYMGQRAISIFGPSEPKRWQPRGANTYTVTPETDCSPCFEIQNENCRTLDCLNSITVDKVIKLINEHFIG